MTSQNHKTDVSERTIRRLLARAAKRRRPLPPTPSVPFGVDPDPNHEFDERTEPAWLFVFFSIFVLLYIIVEKMQVK